MKQQQIILLILILLIIIYILHVNSYLRTNFSDYIKLKDTILNSYYNNRYIYSSDSDESQTFENEINFNKDKFLIFSCNYCGGWADRLKGLLSSYGLALILNRTFIINLEQPCQLGKLIEPNLVKWNQPLPNMSNGDIFDYGIGYNYGALPGFETLDFLKLTDKKYFKINGAIMYANSFAKNKLLEGRIRELGYEPSKFVVFLQTYRWYHELFKLPIRLMPRYQEFLKQAKPNKDSKLICAQVRIGQKSGKGNGDEFFMRRNDTILYWNLMKEEFVQKLYSNKNYKIFITSDQESVKEEAKQYFGSEYVIATQNSSYHFDRDFHSINDPQCQQLENVLYDFHVMQNCDAAVVSHSGFGIIALMNRPNPNENLYIYSLADQVELKNNLWNRSGRKFKFHKINNILEDIYFI